MKHVWTVCTTPLTPLLTTTHPQNKMVNRRVTAAMICFVLLDDDEVEIRGKTRSWKRRKQTGAFSNIVHELRMEDAASFKEMLRMDYDTFLNLLAATEPFISPQESYHELPTIKANERLTHTTLSCNWWNLQIFNYFLYCYLCFWSFD